jgi:hypothetical protein
MVGGTVKMNDIDTEIILATLDFDSLGEGPLAISKMSALMALHGIARAYRSECVPEEAVIRPIIMKKIEFIKAAESKAQLKEILQPPKVRYFGGEVRPVGPYAIPEEELILWSRTSVEAGGPLIAPAANRYRMLFRQVFPELADEFGV